MLFLFAFGVFDFFVVPGFGFLDRGRVHFFIAGDDISLVLKIYRLLPNLIICFSFPFFLYNLVS